MTASLNCNPWPRRVMLAAAIYNLLWGGVISICPQLMLFGNTGSVYTLILIRCIGMLVGTYGIAYYFASTNLARYWPLILVGFIGKVLGPIGAAYYVLTGQLNPQFIWVNVGNDLIWLLPFGWVLWSTWQAGNPTAVAAGPSLYQQFLGNNFALMAPNLQRFHSATRPVRAVGKFMITRGKNPFCRLLALMADLPREATSAEAELIVYPNPSQETWSRRIENKKVVSRQSLRNGLLVERFKVLYIYLTAQVTDGRLEIEDAATSILGIPMPHFFTPKVKATGIDVADGVEVNVDISFKPFGRIINYQGIVRFEETV